MHRVVHNKITDEMRKYSNSEQDEKKGTRQSISEFFVFCFLVLWYSLFSFSLISLFLVAFSSIYSLGVFHISFNWWSFTGVWVTASLFGSPRTYLSILTNLKSSLLFRLSSWFAIVEMIKFLELVRRVLCQSFFQTQKNIEQLTRYIGREIWKGWDR